MNALLGNNFRLVHFLHCIELAIFLHGDAPNLPEPALADDVIEVEMRATHFDVVRLRLGLLFDDDFVLFLVPAGELGQVNFEAVLGLFEGLFTEGGVAPSMVFFNFFPGWHHHDALLAAALLDTELPS